MRHGLSESRIYKIWNNMKQRCYNKKDVSYKYYGGKGISICPEWINDFKAFHDWATSNGYEEKLSIDRIDSNKGYSPDNCRWVTLEENGRRGIKFDNNFTKIRKITGLSQTEFCEKYHISLNTFVKWEQGKREPPDYVVELLEFKVKGDLNMYGEFTLRNFLTALSHDIECEIVTNKYTQMAKTILKEEYIALDDVVEKWDFKDGKLLVWV